MNLGESLRLLEHHARVLQEDEGRIGCEAIEVRRLLEIQQRVVGKGQARECGLSDLASSFETA